MAVANSLGGRRGGARQIECTVNGIGERAGNCSLEEVVMALKTREAFFNLRTGIDTTRLYPTSAPAVEHHGHADSAQQGGGRRERVRARVGHPSARHAQAPLDLRDHASRRRRPVALQPRARQAQRPPRAARAHQATRLRARRRWSSTGVFDEFKALADKKKELFDGDIEALVLRRRGSATAPGVSRTCTTSTTGERRDRPDRAAHADGRHVSAARRSRRRPGGRRVQGHRGRDRHRSPGTAQVRAAQRLGWARTPRARPMSTFEYDGRSYRGSSVSTDIVESSARAFLDVINRIESSRPPSSGRSRLARHAPRRGDASPAFRSEHRQARVLQRSAMSEDDVREGLGAPRGRARDADTPAVLYIDLHLTHEVTSPQAFSCCASASSRCGGPT
jgi:2-isopropylmalate synthase